MDENGEHGSPPCLTSLETTYRNHLFVQFIVVRGTKSDIVPDASVEDKAILNGVRLGAGRSEGGRILGWYQVEKCAEEGALPRPHVAEYPIDLTAGNRQAHVGETEGTAVGEVRSWG